MLQACPSANISRAVGRGQGWACGFGGDGHGGDGSLSECVETKGVERSRDLGRDLGTRVAGERKPWTSLEEVTRAGQSAVSRSLWRSLLWLLKQKRGFLKCIGRLRGPESQAWRRHSREPRLNHSHRTWTTEPLGGTALWGTAEGGGHGALAPCCRPWTADVTSRSSVLAEDTTGALSLSLPSGLTAHVCVCLVEPVRCRVRAGSKLLTSA